MRSEVNSNRFEISNCFEMSFRLHGNLEHVYMIPEVNSNRFEISNRFEMSFRGHVNANNGVTSHQNEISIRFEFTSGLMETCSKSGDLAGMGLHPKKNFATNHGVKHRVYLVTPSFRHTYKYKN